MSPRAEDRPSLLLSVLALLVSASCAGMPIVALAGILIGWR